MRQSLIIAASILIAGATFSIAQNDDPAPRLPAAAIASGALRFQMALTGDGSPTVVVCDTNTGQCWSRYVNGGNSWRDLGIPSEAAKRRKAAAGCN